MANNKSILKTGWNGDATGKGNIKGGFLDTDLAIPTAKGGSGEGTEPKELLISSATACVTMTLSGMLQGRKLSVEQISVETESSEDKETGLVITHHMHVTLSQNATDEEVEAADKAIEVADRRCTIGNMLRKADVQITTKGSVSVA